MLADFLQGARERLVDAVHVAAEAEPPGCGASERRARMFALLDELIEGLRRGGGGGRLRAFSIYCPAGGEEREQFRRAALPAARTPRPRGAAAGVVARDVHDRKLAQIRLQLLSKVSSLVGLGHEELLESIARLSIPELADWGAVDLVEGDRVQRAFLAQRDPAKAPLRDALAQF